MTTTMTRRAVWADDGVWFRNLVTESVSKHGVEIVGVAGTYDETLSVVRTTDPDVAILDVRMPPDLSDEGIRAAIELRATGYAGGLLVVSASVDSTSAGRLVEHCGSGTGYLLKDRLTSVSQVLDAIDRVCAGESVLDPEVVARLVDRPRQSNLLTALTKTELRVLALVAEGLSNRGIAERLTVNERTVESHVSRTFDKLGLDRAPEVHRRVLATIRFLRGLH